MRNDYLVFGGVNSKTYKVGISGEGLFCIPERDYEEIEIDGVNGKLLIDKGRYKNIVVPYECYIVKDFTTNADNFFNAISSKIGYQRLEDSIRTDVYRMAKIKPIKTDVKGILKAGTFKLEFDCKPQRWLKSGEMPTTFNAEGNITNPTAYPAKPIIDIFGTGSGQLYIGSQSIMLNNMDESLSIDCELMDAKKGNTNCNNKVVLPKEIILEGTQKIKFSGDITSVNIIPRWWKL